MSAARLHPSLPAPVVHAGFSTSQSKSHVLAGVQDAYWSDDEAEDAECPLCLEEMDISDVNFKPCVCGYQICRFCWHHIKENLNKRCPACRRVYTDEAVEFKPINTQDHKRLMQQKKQRDRERKELDALGRRHLVNVRVVQRNVIYVLGIGPRFAKEELIPTLRSTEYFGQYGKITKIILVKRTPSGGGPPVVGLYITYHRKEDAARAMAAVDGIPSPGGGKEIMRASHGTTKYCMAFLRGVSCMDHNCMNLHEWGDEKDCFTKEDLTTLKHTIKATESRTRTMVIKRSDEQETGLPRAASWAQKSTGAQTTAGLVSSSITHASRPARRGGAPRQTRSTVGIQLSDSRLPQPRSGVERRTTGTPFSQASNSRPSTPPTLTPDSDARASQKETLIIPKVSNSPAPSTTAESDPGSLGNDHGHPLSSRPSSPGSAQSPMPSMVSVATALPAIPPGLSAPPGILSPSRPPRVGTASPQTPLLSSQSSYQMSTAARALLDDVKARREGAPPATGYSPFPDFDRTLQTLSGGDGGGFSFNLDPKLADEVDVSENLPDFDVDSTLPFNGSYVATFPVLRNASGFSTSHFGPPPGLSYQSNRSVYDPSPKSDLDQQTQQGYVGCFNPFADSSEDDIRGVSSRSTGGPDDDRKVSRFNFARGKHNPNLQSSPSSGSTSIVPNNRENPPFYSTPNGLSPSPQQHWSSFNHQDHSYSQPVSIIGSPLLQLNLPQTNFSQSAPRFQPFEADLSEAQLRDFIQSSQERANVNHLHSDQEQLGPSKSQQPFHDPAIMSASFVSPQTTLTNSGYGPPPGLSPQPGLNSDNAMVSPHVSPIPPLGKGSTHVSTTTSPAPSITLSSSDFPALVTSNTELSSIQDEGIATSETRRIKSQEKAKRRAVQQAAAERAAERQRVAQEKAAAKAAEKAELVRKRAEEKERLLQEVERKRAADLVVKMEHAARLETERVKRAQKQADFAKANLKPKEQSVAHVSETRTKPSLPQVPQVPLLSKKPKKSKPVTRPIRVPKEDEHFQDETSTLLSAATSEAPRIPGQTADSSRAHSRSQSAERQSPRTTVLELFEHIHRAKPQVDLTSHPFFDLHKVASALKMSLEYGPLVHALSALSVGSASFSNNMPSSSIDNAVSSFQQLLETLTQTISDLLRLLPRTTWDDSSSFDGVLRDMLKSDDFLDDTGEESAAKEDEVTALTLALERRARWMEVQLSKLEELHRDINTAAVRAVLAFNDNGWDKSGFLPRITNTLRRFEHIGMVGEAGRLRLMSIDELEKKLIVSKEATVFAETEVREIMEKFQGIKFESTY